MTSICNYSHPELQITEGLTRQDSGILFPYNPEFYKLASGLYGPGTIYCWFLLIISVIINGLFHEKDDKGYRRPGVSNDLLAALAYPTFAATDALIHSLRILRIEYRALAIFCLRFPEVELGDLGPFNHTQLDLRLPIPPEIVTLGQHAIDLGGPLPVCYTFMFMLFLLGFVFEAKKNQFYWEPTTWGKRLACATYGYVFLALTIFHLSLGDICISMILCMCEATMPAILLAFFFLCILVPLSTLGGILALKESYMARNREKKVEGLKGLGGYVFLAVLAGLVIFCVKFDGIPLIPDVGVSISDRDQIAALIGGIVTLCFTVAHIIRAHSKKDEEAEREEMQRLAGDVQ
jgi:hypothetical protein